ncbi:MAG: glycosyltransferase family 2 protein [Acidobacteria bacterium]|nr:glycosyltransferase family 2 protein [Acidobacteriota bacterium]
MIPWFIAIAGTAAAIFTLPGSLELLALTAGAILPARRRRKQHPRSEALARIAVVVPAHDEETCIERCVTSIRGAADAGTAIVVVADNCADRTGELAERAGARVLVRRDPGRRGKGYALDFAFRQLLAEDFDAFIVIDADSVAESNLIAEFRRLFQAGAGAVQCRYLVSNAGESIRTRLMQLALLGFNVLRPKGRDRWGFSAGILGNGFGLTRETLLSVPYEARSVVEDLEYHLRLVRAGWRVWFADAASVWGEMPAAGRGASTQRARWEGGRFRMLGEAGPVLAREVLKGQVRLVEPLLDLLLLPLAFHVLLLGAALAAPGPVRVYAASGIALVLIHVVASIRVGGGSFKNLATLGAAPFYIAWKVLLLGTIWRAAKPDSAWVRTERRTTRGQM